MRRLWSWIARRAEPTPDPHAAERATTSALVHGDIHEDVSDWARSLRVDPSVDAPPRQVPAAPAEPVEPTVLFTVVPPPAPPFEPVPPPLDPWVADLASALAGDVAGGGHAVEAVALDEARAADELWTESPVFAELLASAGLIPSRTGVGPEGAPS